MSVTTYRRALITYVDVIGFRSFIEQSEANQNHVREIDRILRVLRQELTKAPRFKSSERNPEGTLRCFSFSDLTVRATLINNEEGLPNIFNREVETLAQKQLLLACWGKDDLENFPVLFRGAISLGDIAVDMDDLNDEQIFGPALVRSYELESETAVYPRIVIDRDLMAKVKNSESVSGTPFITQRDDGIDFVHYLFGANEFFMTEQPVSSPSSSLKNHKEMIEKTINNLGDKVKKKDRVIQKYLWLVKYHNHTVRQLEQLVEPQNINPEGDAFQEELEQSETDHLRISDELLTPS